MEYFTTLKKKDRDKINSLFQTEYDTTSLIKVVGSAYIGYFVYDGDVLIIDNNITPNDSDKVLVRIGNKECIKIYRIIGEFGYLQTNISTILPEEIGDLKYEVIGVITHILHIGNKGLLN